MPRETDCDCFRRNADQGGMSGTGGKADWHLFAGHARMQPFGLTAVRMAAYDPVADAATPCNQPPMQEEPLTLPWKLGCAVCAIVILVAAGWFILSLNALSHDKSINARLQNYWYGPHGIPVGIVQPKNNAWMKQAFVADRPIEKGKKINLLVLDDHYRGSDDILRTKSGVIGDRIRNAVLCSVPTQAQSKNVALDPAVKRLIATECR